MRYAKYNYISPPTNIWYEYPYPLDHIPFECFNDFKLSREQRECMQCKVENEYDTLYEWDEDVMISAVRGVNLHVWSGIDEY
jgi:hypothetical protein